MEWGKRKREWDGEERKEERRDMGQQKNGERKKGAMWGQGNEEREKKGTGGKERDKGTSDMLRGGRVRGGRKLRMKESGKRGGKPRGKDRKGVQSMRVRKRESATGGKKMERGKC